MNESEESWAVCCAVCVVLCVESGCAHTVQEACVGVAGAFGSGGELLSLTVWGKAAEGLIEEGIAVARKAAEATRVFIKKALENWYGAKNVCGEEDTKKE